MNKKVLSYSLRINEELMKKIRKISENKKRSVNSQIIYVLEKFVQENEKKN